MTASDRPEIGGWVSKRITELTDEELVHIADCVVQAMQQGAYVPHRICTELADGMAKRSEAILDSYI